MAQHVQRTILFLVVFAALIAAAIAVTLHDGSYSEVAPAAFGASAHSTS